MGADSHRAVRVDLVANYHSEVDDGREEGADLVAHPGKKRRLHVMGLHRLFRCPELLRLPLPLGDVGEDSAGLGGLSASVCPAAWS